MRPIKLDDDDWKKIQAFLRCCPQVKVGSARNCRRFVEAVLWMARSGAQWRLLPAEYGNWNSVYKRYARWCEAGVWEALMHHVAVDPDMEQVLLDSTIVRAHPCAAGAQKKWRPGAAGVGAKSGRL